MKTATSLALSMLAAAAVACGPKADTANPDDAAASGAEATEAEAADGAEEAEEAAADGAEEAEEAEADEASEEEAAAEE
ncbi:hypothetical protein [Paraliomyxa miuraensis]|uniref:hypothetical protein n=1 Tax=Paraliomyxa miuraensis TaxID=376150 RepID=UPI002254BCA8|nr:hypothetical protein [Paraliomyxa miuraensis]